jgi:hypothetical protein
MEMRRQSAAHLLFSVELHTALSLPAGTEAPDLVTKTAQRVLSYAKIALFQHK